MVNLALANDESLWDNHDNGKPCDSSGTDQAPTAARIAPDPEVLPELLDRKRHFF